MNSLAEKGVFRFAKMARVDGRTDERRPHREHLQRAAHYAEGRGRLARTGAELLVAIFAETDSPAARLLGEQDMSRQDAINFIIHGIAKGGGDTSVQASQE
jgi:hypothetical protein